MGPCSLSEDAQEIFVWHPTLHGLLCLYVYVVVVSDHFLRLLVIDLEKFSPFLIFSFAEFKPKHKKKKLLLHTYMHSILLLQLFQRPHNRTTTTTNTQIFYATRLLTIFIIYKNYYAVTTTSTTYTSYYTILLSFLKKKTFLESHKCSFFCCFEKLNWFLCKQH